MRFLRIVFPLQPLARRLRGKLSLVAQLVRPPLMGLWTDAKSWPEHSWLQRCRPGALAIGALL